MSIALTEEQQALAESVAAFTARYVSSESTRAEFEDLAAGMWPAIWNRLVEQGFLAMHLPAEHGGDDAGLVELAVLLEETGRGLMPGPLLPTLLTSLVVSRHGGEALRARALPRFVAGATGACATTPEGLVAVRRRDGWEVTGTTAPVLGALSGEHLVLGARAPEGVVWFAVEPEERSALKVERRSGVDLTRDIGCLTAEKLFVPLDRVLNVDSTELRALAAVLFSAEAVGVARWCQEAGLEYAKVREQFGRTIGSFQAVKHKCATIFTRTQLMTAAAWDAASAAEQDRDQFALAAAAAAITCLGGVTELGLDTITLFGGIGYTWEHDAHLYWRRGMSLATLLGPMSEWEELAGRLAERTERTRVIELDEQPGVREEIAARLAEAAAAPEGERRRLLAEAGLVAPHYPKPYGRAADPTTQVVISQEYARAGLTQPSTVIGEWALPTIIAHGTDAQRERFVMPTLRGEIVWCQLFSEPGAGSDLASLRSRAEKTEGGWVLNGQKVWTSSAHEADWGICLARTDPDVPKHKGISYFLVDMRSPGVEVRPLREANGGYLFNEVFFTDVFIPDECLVGRPGEGWRLARTTLGNERVSIGSGMSGGPRETPARAARTLGVAGPEVVRDVGALTARFNSFDALTQRVFLKQLSGLQPGAEASVLKLASGWNAVALRQAALRWMGAGASVRTASDDEAFQYDGDAAQALLSVPPLLIGGGTNEIQLNVIAEQVLRLPREQVR